MLRSFKRELPSFGLERRVRARRADEWELEPDPEVMAASADEGSEAETDEAAAESASDTHTASEPESDRSPFGTDLSASFGALAHLQASHPGLFKARDSSPEPAARKPIDFAPPHYLSGRSRSSNDSAAPEKPKRASKHAPLEQSSKRPVSCHREILTDPRRKYRDPRFDPLVAAASRRPLDEAKASYAYAFLEAYRDSEMADLRAQIAKTKDSTFKERLKRQVMSMESRNKARQRKLQEEELLRDHRLQEKELVAEGKKPFYLKKSEQKKQLFTRRYRDMSKFQVDRAIERKRKKITGKEKKELGFLQRVRDRQ